MKLLAAIRERFLPPKKQRKVPRVTRGRKRKWVARPFDKVDEDLSRQLVIEECPRDTTLQRIRREYSELCGGQTSTTKSFYCFVGQLLRQTSIGTVDTYSGYVWPLVDHNYDNCRLRAAIQLKHAQHLTQHVEGDLEPLRKVVVELPSRSKLAAWMVLNFGLRLADVLRLQPTQVKADRNNFSVRVLVAKGRRRPGTRTIIRIPRIWCGPPPAEFFHFVNGDGAQHRWKVDVSRMNTDLQATITRLNHDHGGQALKLYTTKSLRRRFINDILQRCEGRAEEAARFTLHLNPGMIKAYYETF